MLIYMDSIFLDIFMLQQYSCNMIPEFVDISGCPWAVLPPGIHTTSLEEVKARFTFTPKRQVLFGGLRRGIWNLAAAGCERIFLDGSFVTAKPNPGDYDACIDPTSIDFSKLDPVILELSNGRAAQKKKFLGEYFWFDAQADAFGRPFLEFFQVERNTGKPKGIIEIPIVSGKGGQQ